MKRKQVQVLYRCRAVIEQYLEEVNGKDPHPTGLLAMSRQKRAIYAASYVLCETDKLYLCLWQTHLRVNFLRMQVCFKRYAMIAPTNAMLDYA